MMWRRQSDISRGVLARARAHGWDVAHVLRPQATAPYALGGIAPLPSEPVFQREEASAFSARHFPEFMHRRIGGLTAILSLDLDCGTLVTALSAAEAGHRVTMLTDAAGHSDLARAVHGVVVALKTSAIRLARFDSLPQPSYPRALAANQP
jgi:hypothetical protein